MPIMARVENLLSPRHGGVGRVLAAARDQFHRRSMRAHLHGLGRTGGSRRHDRRRHATGGGIGGHGRAAIAGAVFQHRRDPLRAEEGQHDAGAAILEAAGGHEPLAFEKRPRPMEAARQQRCAAFAHADGIVGDEGEGGTIAPKAARRKIDAIARDAGQRRQQQRHVAGAAPARHIQRKGFTRAGGQICGVHDGGVWARGRCGSTPVVAVLPAPQSYYATST